MKGEVMEIRVGAVIIPLSCKIHDPEKDNPREVCPALYTENGQKCCLFAKDDKTPTKIIADIKECPLVKNIFTVMPKERYERTFERTREEYYEDWS